MFFANHSSSEYKFMSFLWNTLISYFLSFLPLIRNLFFFPLFQGTYLWRPCLPFQLGVHPINHQLCDNNINKRLDRQDSIFLSEEILAVYSIFVIYEKLYHWITQFESFHWLSHHELWVIIPWSANMVRYGFGVFLFLF